MKTFYFFLCLFLGPLLTFSQLDQNGWTVLDPGSTSKVIYVSSSEGDDGQGVVYDMPSSVVGNGPMHPVGAVKPYKTVAAAARQVSNGEPAWILLKRGDVFYEGLVVKSGKSGKEPLLYSSYGTKAAPPMLKTGASPGIVMCCRGVQNFWVVGLSFYAHTRDPDGPEYVGTAGESGLMAYANDGYRIENILIEGCVFQFYANNTVQRGRGEYLGDFRIRRNVFLNNYSEEGHSQGLYASNVDELLVEGNIFDHNGWYKQSKNADNNKSEGQATIFNHDTYFADVHNVTFRGNSFHRPSSIGTKWTANKGTASSSNIKIEDNLYNDCEVGISIGGNENEPLYRFRDIEIKGNVLTSGGLSRQTNRALGWYVEINDWGHGLMEGNLLVDQGSDEVTNGQALKIVGTNRDVEIKDNILYGLKHTYYVWVQDESYSNVSIKGNAFTLPDEGAKKFMELRDKSYASLFQGNSYSWTGEVAQPFSISYKGMGYDDWLAASGEKGSSVGRPNYPDPGRGLDRYITEVLGLSGRDAFYAELRGQNMLNWREEYTAGAINKWIKEGFGVLDAGDSNDRVTSNTSVDLNETILYPNPGDGRINIQSILKEGTISVVSSTGRTILKRRIGANATLDVSYMPVGMYLIQFSDHAGSHKMTYKYIKY